MIILGIDPGLAIVGYGVIKVERNNFTAIDYGVINTPKTEPIPVRLKIIADLLEKLIQKFQPDCVAIEELFFNKNVTTAIAVAQARGVILLTTIKECGKLFEYTPLQIKQAITGYGRAEKKQIQLMVQRLLRLDKLPRPDDAADALAVAICHGQTNRLSGGFSIMK